MAQKIRTEKLPLPNLVHPEFLAIGKKRVEEFVKAQKELLDKLQETSRQWFERMQLKVNVASEFASIPDAATVCQELMTRWFEMMADDGKRLFAETQKFMETGGRLLANSGRSGGPGAGTWAGRSTFACP